MRHFLILSLFVALLAPVSEASDAKPTIVTSIRPLSLLARDLAGEDVAVKQLLADNQEPHHVALTVSQRRLLGDADLVLWVGPGLESFLADAMTAVPGERQLAMATVAKAGFPDLETAGSDPHLWLDPQIVKVFYRHLAATLGRQYPSLEAALRRRLEAVESGLDSRVEDIAVTLGPLTDRPVIVDHQAYGRFARYFGITISGALVDESGIAIGARSYAALRNSKNVACVVVEQEPVPRSAANLAEALGVDVVVIDPLGQRAPEDAGLEWLLADVAAGFEECLSGG